MPTDDELRRVAEDVRALARSLVRDVRSGVDEARKEAKRSGRVIRDEMREAARQSRRDFRHGGRGSHHHHGYRWEAAPADADAETEDDAEDGPPEHGRPERSRPPAAPRPARPPRPARTAPPLRHRRDSSTVLGLVALILGLSWLAAATHLFAVPWKAAVAVALMALGAAMVVTARTDWALSRRAWPMVLGATLVAILALGTASIAWPTFGNRKLAWTTWDQVPTVIEASWGRTTVNLPIATPLASNETVTIHDGAGSLEVTIPANLRVHLDATINAGSISYPGDQTSGPAQRVIKDLGPPSGPVLSLNVRAGFGSVRIKQSAAA